MSEIRQWNEGLPYLIEHRAYEAEYTIVHQGLAVPVSELEASKERCIWEYYPKFFIASDDDKQKMLAKALWTRLQKLGKELPNEKAE